jgi:putative SOS response-associated peptidase YedK
MCLDAKRDATLLSHSLDHLFPLVLLLKPNQFEHWLCGNMGVEELKPVENDYLQRWAVSKRVSSSKADSNDPTLIDAVKRRRSYPYSLRD